MKNQLLILAASLILFGCAKQSPNDKSNVSVNIRGDWPEERTYSNEHFEIQIKIPEEWHLVKGQQEHVKEAALKFVSGDDRNLNTVFETAIDKMFNPFWAYRHPPGTPGVTNPNVTCIIENVKHLPGIKTGGDYLLVARDTMKMSNAEMYFLDSPKQTTIGNIDFFVQESRVPIGKLEITQRYYAQRKGDYILLIGINLITEEDEKSIEEIVSTIKRSTN